MPITDPITRPGVAEPGLAANGQLAAQSAVESPEPVPVVVNGSETHLPPSQPLLTALRDAGITLPGLCNDVRHTQALGNCGLCVVEVEADTGAIRTEACQIPVTAGLRINTAPDDIRAFRKLRLEQLLANHNADCVAPCQVTCPAGIDIQLYLQHTANGNFDAAIRVIKDANPFPSACARVCPHPCEAACRRNLVDEPVAINTVKRFLADWDASRATPYRPLVAPPTGKTVAVVGAGPAGLSAAYYLAQQGHRVTVFEKQPEPGGMMRYGIPAYRLPTATLDAEIATITDLGVEVRCRAALGVQVHLADLQSEFGAVYLAFGSWQATPLGVAGETLPGVWDGIGFLEQVVGSNVPRVGDDVVVVGGGNTAIDCSRTALRLGAQRVRLLYRRTREEMPAEDHEIADALDEGVEAVYLAAPDRIEAIDPANPMGRKRLWCIRMALGEPDRSGRRRPNPVPGSEFAIEADSIIGAIGQRTNTQMLYTDLPVKLSKWGDIEIDPDTSATNQAGVFAGGDCVSGPATVIAAVGAGRRAAVSIDGYLRTGTPAPVATPYRSSRGSLEDLPREEFQHQPRLTRIQPPRQPAPERARTFEEIDLPVAQAAARAEAQRCLDCGCRVRYACELRDEASAAGLVCTEPLHERPRFEPDLGHPYLIRDQNKCITCGKCIAACADLEGVDVLGYRYQDGHLVVGTKTGAPLEETACVSCGQCAAACPCGALDFRRESDLVWQAINDPETTVVGFLAPAPRSVVAARFGWGAIEATDRVAGLLRRLGFDRCFDVAFAADLTIVEEANEFLGRLRNGGTLPQFTSCCPGWVDFVEKRYPSLIPNLSTCRSPQQMMGAVLKAHYAKLVGVAPERLFVVSIMPCLAKKVEARRSQLAHDDRPDVDAVLTTRELLEMTEQMRIDPSEITPGTWDEPYSRVSSAGVLFGASGGVAEAALRMATEALTGETLAATDLEFHEIRGMAGVKTATVNYGAGSARVAVTAGLGVARPLIEAAARGEDVGFDLIEVMACPGGCVGGAGNPAPKAVAEVENRQQVLYDIDAAAGLRKSHENTDVWGLYRDLLGSPGSEVAHELLHTTFTDRRARIQ